MVLSKVNLRRRCPRATPTKQANKDPFFCRTRKYLQIAINEIISYSGSSLKQGPTLKCVDGLNSEPKTGTNVVKSSHGRVEFLLSVDLI